jgi:RNA polymerase sigma-70 factor (ECF subfamily)
LTGKPNSERSAAEDDRSLVEAAQAGDREALGELFARHVTTVRRLLTSVIGPSRELDDLVQEVFLQAHRALPRFRREARFSTWLHQIAVNTAITHLRRPRGRFVTTAPEALERRAVDDGADAHASLVGRQMVERLYAILDTVTPKRRAAFTLFEIEGRSIAEVAAIVGVPATVAKSRIWFARREIKRKAAGDELLGPLLEELMR